MNNKYSQTDWFLIGLGVFVFVIIFCWAVFFIPMNMDEAGIFHPLACWTYPFSFLHQFREGCPGHDMLTTPLGFQIAHAEPYTGIWHTLLYAPFYFLFHAPYGQYVFGLVFLALFAWLMSRENAKPYLSFVLYLSFFPFLFQFIHDMGPVKFAMLMFPLGVLLLRKIMQSPVPLSYAYAVVLALLCLCGIEEKPFFLYTLPSLALFALAFMASGYDKFRTLLLRVRSDWRPLAVAGGIGFIGLALLFFSMREDRYYGVMLFSLSQSKLPFDMWVDYFIDFMTFWPAYAHNYHDILSASVNGVLFRLAVSAFFIFCIITAAQQRAFASYPRLKLHLLLASSVVTFIIFLFVRNEWAGHHFVFLLVPLMVLFVDLVVSLSPGLAMIAVTGLMVLNLWSVLTLTQTGEKVQSSSEREAIFAYFASDAVASQSIINFSSWGAYYTQALYGPKTQLAIYSEPYAPERIRNTTLAPKDADRLLELAAQTNRRLYNVCMGALCNKPRLEGVFTTRVNAEEVIPGLPNWHVFLITPRTALK